MSAARVAAIDDQVSGQPVEQTEHRNASDLALTGGNRPARKDRPEGHDVQEALVVGDDDAGAMPLELVAAVHLDLPPHHSGQAAAEDPSVDIESLSVSGGDEQPEDPGSRTEHEPASSDDKA